MVLLNLTKLNLCFSATESAAHDRLTGSDLPRQISLPSTLREMEDTETSLQHHNKNNDGGNLSRSDSCPSPRLNDHNAAADTTIGSQPSSNLKLDHSEVSPINSSSFLDVKTNMAALTFDHPQDNSDSGTSMSVVSSSDNSGGSIPPNCGDLSASQISHLMSAEDLLNCNSDIDNNDSLIASSLTQNGQTANSLQESSENCESPLALDMSVQSAGLVFPPGGILSDAPILPPRTYKINAPPLPPRVYKKPAPPIPPRHTNERQKRKPMTQSMSINSDQIRNSLEPPPPLPPRTYSPIEFGDTSDSGGSIPQVSDLPDDGAANREQELFPWGPPTTSNTCSPNSSHPSNSTNTQPPPLVARQYSKDSSSNSSSHLVLVPLNEAEQSSSGLPSHPPAILSAPRIDSTPGSRGSLALSTISEPSTSASNQADKYKLKRRSVDGQLSQLAQLDSESSNPPQLMPRNRQISNEERQKNRHQISKQLENWTRIQKTKTSNQPSQVPNASAVDSSSPPSFSECELGSPHEQAPPLPSLPPPSSHTPNNRGTDSPDGSPAKATTSSGVNRERSGERRGHQQGK